MRTTRTTAVLGLAVAAVVAAAPAAEAVTTTNVTVKNFQFVSSTVTIQHGQAVKWTNVEFFTTHTVTRTGGAWTVNRTLTPRTSFTRTFTTPGTYRYHCAIHGVMTGTVIVK